MKHNYYIPNNLLTVNNDYKTKKGTKKGFLTGILYLAPYNISGFNVCPRASTACKTTCLYKAGRGKMSNTQQSRINKTKYLFSDTECFMMQLCVDINRLIQKANKENMTCCVRLNGTSDIDFTASKYRINGKTIFECFPDVQFYDYTKVYRKLKKNKNLDNLDNYHLTFSFSGDNWQECKEALKEGFNVACVFRKDLPKTYEGYEVINGDINDLRFLDKHNVIVGLKLKGNKKLVNNFIIEYNVTSNLKQE